MRLNYKLSTIFFVFLFIFLSVFCGCDNVNSNVHKSTYDELNLIRKESHVSSDTAKAITDNEVIKDEDENKLNKNNRVSKNDKITRYGFEFSNFNFYKSKDLPPDIKREDFIYFLPDDKFDEKGRLQNETSYFFFSMDVINKNNKNMNLCWFNICPILIEDKGNYNYPIYNISTITSWEARYRNKTDKDSQISKDYFIDDLIPNEKVSIAIGYIIDDEYIDDKRMCISPEKCITTVLHENNYLKYIMINE